jgi:hypothetical protein
VRERLELVEGAVDGLPRAHEYLALAGSCSRSLAGPPSGDQRLAE